MGQLVRLRALVAALALSIAAAPPAEAASELNDQEIARLHRGEPVTREDVIDHGGRRYVGGITYIIIDAPPDRVLDAVDDVRAYRQLLPATRQVRWLGVSRAGEAVVQLEQGSALVHARYVVRTRRQPAVGGSASVLRFWLDARFPHDVADAQGYFRAEPLGDRTLMTYGAWVDLGPGLLSRLLEGKVRRMALSTPVRVKGYVESLRPFG